MEKKPSPKITFDCAGEDRLALNRIMAYLQKTSGPTPASVAMRYALRKAAKGLPR